MTKVKFLKAHVGQEGLAYEKGKTVEIYDDAYARELVRREIAEDVKEGKAESKPDPAAEPEPIKRKAPPPEPEPEPKATFRSKPR